jgi:hypothetical protein
MSELVRYRNPPLGVSMSVQATLLQAVSVAPYEGLWVPFEWVRQATVEVLAGATTPSIDIYATNQDNPSNSYILTVGGTITTNDVITLVFAPGNSAPFNVAYTVVAGDTTTTILAGHIAAAINANASAQALGIAATSNAAVITVTWPSTAPSVGVAEFQQPSSPPQANTLLITYTAGGNTETIARTQSTTDGTNLTASHLTGAGLVTLTPFPVRWVKARLTALAGGTATVNIAGVA